VTQWVTTVPKRKNTVKSKNAQPPLPPWLKCGEVGTYSKLNEKRAKPKFERDHVPSHAAMNRAAQDSPKMKGASADERACVKGRLKARALTIAIPKSLHRGYSRTCGSRNKDSQIQTDSGGLDSAANKDLARIQRRLDSTKSPCAAAYRSAAKMVRAQNHKKLINDIIKECLA
jgi:hypothetical protein